MTVVLHGLKYSVYTRIARMVLQEKGVPYEQVEVNPFDPDMPKEYLELHPFRRVPTLVHGDIVLYETGAITHYIDETFDGPDLQPTGALARARMNQIMSIVDNYAYQPMVRQVFSHRVFLPLFGQATEEGQVRAGLEASEHALKALNVIAAEGVQLSGAGFSLADFHLAPMVAYFTAAEEGREMLTRFPALNRWWEIMNLRGSLLETAPELPANIP